MSAPLGYTRRHEPGLVGLAARLWLAHRTRQVRRALAALRTAPTAPRP